MRLDLSKISYNDFSTLYPEGSQVWQQAYDAATPLTGSDWWQLTIKDFGEMLNNDIPEPLTKMFHVEQNATTWLRLYKGLHEFLRTFVDNIARFVIPMDAEQAAAAGGLPTFNDTEGLLVFARGYFGLRSFTDAEAVTLADVFLAKKDTYIQAMYEKNYNKIQQNKFKSKIK